MKYINNKIQYEVGDWVTLMSKDEIEATVQLTKIEEDKFYYEPYNAGSLGKWGRYSGSYRLATQKEIDEAIRKADVIKIGEHKVSFYFGSTWSGASHIMVGCQKVTYEDWQKIGREAKWIPSS